MMNAPVISGQELITARCECGNRWVYVPASEKECLECGSVKIEYTSADGKKEVRHGQH
jgi:hypothetical protein